MLLSTVKKKKKKKKHPKKKKKKKKNKNKQKLKKNPKIKKKKKKKKTLRFCSPNYPFKYSKKAIILHYNPLQVMMLRETIDKSGTNFPTLPYFTSLNHPILLIFNKHSQQPHN